MRQRLKKELVQYFENIANRNHMEEMFLSEIKGQLEFFEITSVSRDDLTQAGFNGEKATDGQMEELASKMADAYCDSGFWIDIDILAEHIEIPTGFENCEAAENE